MKVFFSSLNLLRVLGSPNMGLESVMEKLNRIPTRLIADVQSDKRKRRSWYVVYCIIVGPIMQELSNVEFKQVSTPRNSFEYEEELRRSVLGEGERWVVQTEE